MDTILQKRNVQIAENWFKAFNSQNLEQLLQLYAEDARHFSPKLKIRQPETQGWISGRPALRTWWRDSFERLPDLHYQPERFTANDHRVFMEYLRKVPGEVDMQVAEVLEIQDGMIVSSKVYHG